MNPIHTLDTPNPSVPTWLEDALDVINFEDPMESENSTHEEVAGDHRLGFI